MGQWSKIGFIGVGNMGGALARAAAKSADGQALFLADANADKAAGMAAALGGTVSDNHAIACGCDCIFLGVKPQVLPAVLRDIRDDLSGNPQALLVSMAAGVPIDTLQQTLGDTRPILRIMPNTPASICKGVILYTANAAVTPKQERAFCALMAAAGEIDRIDEGLIDAASAVSGCGPAFAYLFIEALADGAVSCGLPRDKALRYAAQTVSGAAELMLSSGEHPGALKDAVCSPAGSTVEGVLALENGGFRAAAAAAVRAAYRRTKELGSR